MANRKSQEWCRSCKTFLLEVWNTHRRCEASLAAVPRARCDLEMRDDSSIYLREFSYLRAIIRDGSVDVNRSCAKVSRALLIRTT